MILLAAVAAKLVDPHLYEDRVASPDNFYQRVAQHRETLRVVQSIRSLAWDLVYTTMLLLKNPRYMTRWKGIESMNVPHNVLMTVLSEEGLVGLFFMFRRRLFLFGRCGEFVKSIRRAGWRFFTVFLFTC